MIDVVPNTHIEENAVILALRKYDYLDTVIVWFWPYVFDDTREGREGWKGMVVAHGDKCDQYMCSWEEVGIPPNRGALLYLLTYTSELGNTPKHESYQWVIDNYPKYKLALQKAELEAYQRRELNLRLDALDSDSD